MIDIEGELKAALNVAPSPKFVARVRAEVARMPAPSSGRSYFAAAVAAGGLAVALFAGTAFRVDRESAPVTAGGRLAVVPDTTLALTAVAAPTPAAKPLKKSTRSATVARVVPTEPEVLVPAGGLALMNDLYVALNEGRVEVQGGSDATAFVPVELRKADLTTVQAMDVEIIPQMVNVEGVRQ